MNTITLDNLFNKIQQSKADFQEFQKSEEVSNYIQEKENRANNMQATLQWIQHRIYTLIRQNISQDISTEQEDFIKEHYKQHSSLQISLDLIELFRAGYSTNVDKELIVDIQNMKEAEHLEILLENWRDLFADTMRSHINTNLGKLTIKGKSNPKAPIFIWKAKYIPFNTMALSEINHKEYYKQSESIADQLAYYFYHNAKDISADNFSRLWDHHKYQWINGLSCVFYFLIDAYLQGKNEYIQYISWYSDIHSTKVIEKFNEVFTWHFQVQLSKNPQTLIYTIQQ